MLKLTQTGVADIGYVAPGYTSDKMPVSEVAHAAGRLRPFLPGHPRLLEAGAERRDRASRIMPPTISGCCWP